MQKPDLYPKKILYISQFAQVGGGETALLYLLSKLNTKKFEAHIILPQKGQFYQRLKNINVKIYILDLPPYLVRTLFIPGSSPIAIIKLLKLTRKINPDLIHINHLQLSIYAGIVANILKIPTVGTAHGVWDSLYFYQNLIYKFFLKTIIANTPETALNIRKHGFYKTNKIKTVLFGIDTNLFKPASLKEKIQAKNIFNIPNGYIVISIIGRLDPQKDHMTFLKCAKIILEKHLKVFFLIVGGVEGDFSKKDSKGNYLKGLKNFIASERQLSNHLKFTPYQEDIRNIYRATDIAVSTSSSPGESFGLALLEAASSEIPVVSTKNWSQQLIIKDGQTGYLVKPQNPKSQAEKICKLISNSRLRHKFAKNARKHAILHFQLQDYVKNIEKIYLSLI